MAEGTRLELTFTDSNGKKILFAFNHAKQSPGLANIKALMAGIITNGSIFANVPVASAGAKEVTTTELVYNLNA